MHGFIRYEVTEKVTGLISLLFSCSTKTYSSHVFFKDKFIF